MRLVGLLLLVLGGALGYSGLGWGWGVLGLGLVVMVLGQLRAWTRPPAPRQMIRGSAVGLMGAMGVGSLHYLCEALPPRATGDEVTLRLIPHQPAVLTSGGEPVEVDAALADLIAQHARESKAVPRLTIRGRQVDGAWSVDVQYE